MVGDWIARHTQSDAIAAFEAAEAAIAPIYDIADIMADPQYQALESILTVEDEELGPIKMQNVLFRLSETPGAIRSTGPRLGEHNAEVYGALGLDEARLAELKAQAVI